MTDKATAGPAVIKKIRVAREVNLLIEGREIFQQKIMCDRTRTRGSRLCSHAEIKKTFRSLVLTRAKST